METSRSAAKFSGFGVLVYLITLLRSDTTVKGVWCADDAVHAVHAVHVVHNIGLLKFRSTDTYDK